MEYGRKQDYRSKFFPFGGFEHDPVPKDAWEGTDDFMAFMESWVTFEAVKYSPAGLEFGPPIHHIPDARVEHLSNVCPAFDHSFHLPATPQTGGHSIFTFHDCRFFGIEGEGL